MDLITDGTTTLPILSFGIGYLFKIVFAVLLILYLGYSFFLALRVKVLIDTITTPWNRLLGRLAYFHLYAVLVVGGLALFLMMIA